jgi:hypothetical protein
MASLVVPTKPVRKEPTRSQRVCAVSSCLERELDTISCIRNNVSLFSLLSQYIFLQHQTFSDIVLY